MTKFVSLPIVLLCCYRWIAESARHLMRSAKTSSIRKASTTSVRMNLWSTTRWNGSVSRLSSRPRARTSQPWCRSKRCSAARSTPVISPPDNSTQSRIQLVGQWNPLWRLMTPSTSILDSLDTRLTICSSRCRHRARHTCHSTSLSDLRSSKADTQRRSPRSDSHRSRATQVWFQASAAAHSDLLSSRWPTISWPTITLHSQKLRQIGRPSPTFKRMRCRLKVGTRVKAMRRPKLKTSTATAVPRTH